MPWQMRPSIFQFLDYNVSPAHIEAKPLHRGKASDDKLLVDIFVSCNKMSKTLFYIIPRTEGVFYLFGGRADRAIFTSSSCGRPLGSLGPKGPKCWSIITLQRGYVILQDATP